MIQHSLCLLMKKRLLTKKYDMDQPAAPIPDYGELWLINIRREIRHWLSTKKGIVFQWAGLK